MNEDTLRPIIRYVKASADKQRAIEAHRDLLKEDWESYRRTDYYRFMHEVDNPVPDLALRAMYRERLSRD